MAIKVGNTNITSVSVDGTTINLVKDSNNNYLWARPFTLTINSGTGVASVGTSRTSTYSPEANTGSFYDGKIYYGDSIYISASPSTGYELDAYTYSIESITGNTTINITAHLKSYTITFALGGSQYGSWGSATKTAYYGDVLSRNGNTVTCYQGSSSTARWTNTFTNGSATGYTYSVSYNSITSPVTGAQTITATTSRSLTIWHVYITAGDGISSVYLSTSSTATSGDSSGAYFQYGSTVYGFVVLAQYFRVPTDGSWTLISGTANETGAKYRVGSLTVQANDNNNFGTINAIRKTTHMDLIVNTGVDKIYYRSPSTGSYTAYSSTDYITGYYGYTYDWYATAKSGYVLTGTTSGSGTITGTVRISPQAQAFTLQEPTIYSNGYTTSSGRNYKQFKAYNPNSVAVTLEYKSTLDSSNSTVTLAASGWTTFNSSGYSNNVTTAGNAYLTYAKVSYGSSNITMSSRICKLVEPNVTIEWVSEYSINVYIENPGANPYANIHFNIYAVDGSGNEWEYDGWYDEEFGDGNNLGPTGDFVVPVYTQADWWENITVLAYCGSTIGFKDSDEVEKYEEY